MDDMVRLEENKTLANHTRSAIGNFIKDQEV
jgi:hypothetical protein